MIELVLGSFVVAFLPMILDLATRIVKGTPRTVRWTSDYMLGGARHHRLTIHANPTPVGPMGALKHGH